MNTRPVALKQLLRLAALDQLIRKGCHDLDCFKTKKLPYYDSEAPDNEHYPDRAELCKVLGCAEKTFHRDMAVARNKYKAIIRFSRKHWGYYYLDFPGKTLESVLINPNDILALEIAKQSVSQYSRTPLKNQIQKILDCEMIEMKKLFPSAKLSLDGCLTLVPIPAPPLEEEVWREMLRGLRDRKSVKIVYDPGWPAQEGSERGHFTINPYHMANLEGDWYVIADRVDPDKAKHDNCNKALNMARIKSAQVQSSSFCVPRSFNAANLLSHTLGRFVSDKKLEEVRIRFSNDIRALVKDRKFHPRQTVKELKNGDIVLSFKVSAAGVWPFFHVVKFVLSFGRHATVLAPKKLKDCVKEELRLTAKNYK